MISFQALPPHFIHALNSFKSLSLKHALWVKAARETHHSERLLNIFWLTLNHLCSPAIHTVNSFLVPRIQTRKGGKGKEREEVEDEGGGRVRGREGNGTAAYRKSRINQSSESAFDLVKP